MKRNLLKIGIWLALSSCAVSVAFGQQRTWTSKQGNSIQAELALFDKQRSMVTLRMTGGKQVKLPLQALSDADIEFLVNPPKPEGLTFVNGWDAKVKGEDLKRVLAKHVTPVVDLTRDPEIEIFRGVHYLDDLETAKATLFKGDTPFETRVQVSTQGFPYRSIYYYNYDFEFIKGYRHISIVTDAAKQVVAIQLLNNTPRYVQMGNHSFDWHYFNFLLDRKKGKPSYSIAHLVHTNTRIVVSETAIEVPGNVLLLQSELIDDKYPPGSREWVLMWVPKKFASVMLSLIQ